MILFFDDDRLDFEFCFCRCWTVVIKPSLRDRLSNGRVDPAAFGSRPTFLRNSVPRSYSNSDTFENGFTGVTIFFKRERAGH